VKLSWYFISMMESCGHLTYPSVGCLCIGACNCMTNELFLLMFFFLIYKFLCRFWSYSLNIFEYKIGQSSIYIVVALKLGFSSVRQETSTLLCGFM